MIPNGQDQRNWIPEPKAWTIVNSGMAAMGAVILVLLGLGYNSIQEQRRLSDILIMAQLTEIKLQTKETALNMVEMIRTVAVLKTNQDVRLERERIELNRRFK